MPRTTCHGTTSRSPGSHLCWVTETTVSPLLLSLLTDLDQCPVLSPVDTLHSVLEHYTFKHPTCPVSLIYLARTGLISLRHPQEESDIVSLGKTLGVPDADKLKTEWGKFKYNAMKHELYCGSEQELRTKPEIFFASLLNSKTFQVNPIVRNFLHHVMVIPTGELMDVFMPTFTNKK